MKRLARKTFVQLLALALLLILFDSAGVSLAISDISSPASLAGSKANYSNAPVPETPFSILNPNKVYFSDFGQFVPNPLLRFWRLNGRFGSYGGPISRTFVDSEGHSVQYFQKMALAYYPELANTAWEIRPYHIGRLWLDAQTDEVKNVFPFGKAKALANTRGQKFFPETSHNVTAGFLELYNKTNGLFTWGFPLSEEYSQTLADGKTYNMQLFERGRMIWQQETGSIVDSNFGTEMADFNKANMAVELNPEPLPGRRGVPEYSTWAFEHWVDVNLATQSETFYEGDIPVRNNLVTTGTKGHETPTGTFQILRTVYNEEMKGGTIGAEDYYDLKNVLYTMYFTWEGHALHYAWWRSVFGYVGSHGCVNEDLKSAEFAWTFLKIGSRVNIHY